MAAAALSPVCLKLQLSYGTPGTEMKGSRSRKEVPRTWRQVPHPPTPAPKARDPKTSSAGAGVGVVGKQEEWNEKAFREITPCLESRIGLGHCRVFKDRPFPFPVSFQRPNSPPKARLEVRVLECVSLG